MLEIVIGALISFTIAFSLTPMLAEKVRKAGITGRDMNKYHHPEKPEMGGLGVVIGFFMGFIIVLVLMDIEITPELGAAVFAIFGAVLVGALDDLVNLRQRVKALLPFLLALPFAFNLSDNTIIIPFLGSIDFGLIMLILVPFAVTSAANVTNMLEGFNGLGAGLCIVIAAVLAIIAVIQNDIIPLVFLLPFIGAVIGFFYYNVYPAKVFPGDIFTIFAGALIATSAILGNLEFLGALLFAPMIIEFFLKINGRRSKKRWADSFGMPDERGILRHSGPVESLTHLLMNNGRFREGELVRTFLFFELLLGGVVIAVYLISINSFTVG